MYKVASLMKYNISRWRSRYHILLGVVYLFMLGDMMLHPARKLVQILQVTPTTSAFSLLWNSPLFLILFYFGVLIFFSDAPFEDDMSGYMMIRCGKMKFMEAQIVYIFFLGSLIPLLFFVSR